MLLLAGPRPSSLYKNAKLLPGKGASSKIAPSDISVETISNLVVDPSTDLEKLKAGTSEFVELNLYCSVGIHLYFLF